MALIIVESPTKSRTISKFLGGKYLILSSKGHIRDLPKKEFGVDTENNFKEKYVIPKKARAVIKKLKEASKKEKSVVLATDEDREGEAIAWHLLEVLKLKNYKRIVFHEITKEAIKKALSNPRKIDANLVAAQRARRILDRIVGYKLSPFLWKKVARRLSAGRVQSAALRLVVEREKEIKAFRPKEYWTIVAKLKKKEDKESFQAILTKKDGKAVSKFFLQKKEEGEKIVKEIENEQWKVKRIEKKNLERNPFPPFTTSTLQQEAWKRFHWPAKKTMRLAQQLYEEGFITYHRSDSLNLSNLSLGTAKKFIEEKWGKEYYQWRKFKTKSKTAQEAHEAIRPTFPQREPQKIKTKEKEKIKLYELIWQRFIASQMKGAIFEVVKGEIEVGDYLFEAKGQTLKFDGFLRIYPLKIKEETIPHLEKGEILKLEKLSLLEHFTQPPARYTEASLIKEMEKNGIGRPSTYAPIVSNIQTRNYIEKDKKGYFQPTEMGSLITEILTKHFPEIVDINFTARMEEKLDEVAKGKISKEELLKEFYQPFAKNLEKKYKEVSKKEFTEKPTDKICPK